MDSAICTILPKRRQGDQSESYLTRAKQALTLPQVLLFGIVVLLFAVVRIWHIWSFCLDCDEIFSLNCARQSWRGLLSAVTGDVVHPPLFYGVLKVWIAIAGDSRLWVRVLPCLLSLASLGPILLLFRQLRLPFSGRMIALACIAVNGDLVLHARYLRMYSLVLLLSLFSLCLFQIFVHRCSRLAGLGRTAINLLLVYTHYYGWAVILAELAFVIWRARSRLLPFALSATLVFLLFAPWGIAVAEAAAAKGGLQPNLGWISRPGLGEAVSYVTGLNGALTPLTPSIMLYIPWGVAVIVGLGRLRRVLPEGIGDSFSLVLLLTLIPPVASFVLSHVLPQSVWGNRHLVVSTVFWLMLAGLAICRLPVGWVRLFGYTATVVWTVWAASLVTLHPEPRLNLEVLVRQMAEETFRNPVAQPVNVHSLDPYLPFQIRYHLEPYQAVRWNVTVGRRPLGAMGDCFWLVYRDRPFESPSKTSQFAVLHAQGHEILKGIWAGDRWDKVVALLVRKQRENPA